MRHLGLPKLLLLTTAFALWRTADAYTRPPAPRLAAPTLHADSALSAKEKGFSSQLKQVLEAGTGLFPLLVLSSSLLGTKHPSSLTWFAPYVTPALSLTMLFMGMTLSIDDFRRVGSQPKFVLLGFLAQYVIMPLSAFVIARVAKLGPSLSSGLILVGCAPGGTASNLVTLIAQADVALSVVMTACSTLAAVVMTPWLTTRLAGSYVAIRSQDLVLSTMQVVLAPVATGLVINTK